MLQPMKNDSVNPGPWDYRKLNSDVPMLVWLEREEGHAPERFGELPAVFPLEIPEGYPWWVDPIPEDRGMSLDLRRVADAVSRERIWGLQLYLNDSNGLEHLAG